MGLKLIFNSRRYREPRLVDFLIWFVYVTRYQQTWQTTMTIESEIHHQDTLPQSNRQPGLVEGTIPKECLSCRLIGTGALGGVGSYALWQSRATAPGSLGQKRVVAGLGVGQKFTLLPGTITLINGHQLY